MTRIVTTHYRYKRPPRKKQAVPLARRAWLPPTEPAAKDPEKWGRGPADG